MNPKLSYSLAIAAWLACTARLQADELVAPLSDVPQGQAGPAAAFLQNSDEPTPSATQALEATDGQMCVQYLLKLDDSILPGIIEDAGSEYCVRRGANRILIPKSQVQTIGDSLADLYAYRAHRIPIHDLAMRLKLAQWCFDQGILEAALAESTLVLQQDPDSRHAQRIVKMSRAILHPETKETAAPETLMVAKRRYPDPSRVVSQFKSAYGADLFDEFQSMQGLLITSCGKGGCHAASRHDGPFKLFYRPERGPMDVRLTSRNLMALLDSIDYQQPMRSALLYKALERHGTAPLPPLGGVQDPTYLRLQQWVLEVTRRWSGNEIEVDPRQLAPAIEADVADDDVFASGQAPRRKAEDSMLVRQIGRPEPPVLEPGDEVAKIRSGPPLADDAPPPRRPVVPANVEELAPEEDSVDPYDPSAFNKGRPNASTKRRSIDASRIVEMRDGKAVVKRTVTLPGLKEGTFEAAAPPFNLLPAANLSSPPSEPVSKE